MSGALRWGIQVVVTMLASACANLDSIQRSTQLSRDNEGGQTAVHLDAKQRVIVSKDATEHARFMAICAEPSPDALSAYAQSLGLSLAVPTKGSASGSQASSETAASIGLRTQSITLMRDSLYRVCEAYYNRALNGPQVLQLINHAQDVTVAILAIEQLTGVTAAQQVVLGGSASAVATSQVAYAQALLDATKENTKNRNDELTAAKADEAKAQQARDAAQAALNAEPDTTKKVPLQATLNQKESDLAAAKAKTATAQARADDAKSVQDAIEKNPTQALSNTSASASGSGQFGNAIATVKLDAASTEKIATAVESIVKTVVAKKYVVEACMAFMTRNWDAKELAQQQYIESLDLCRAILRKEQGI